MCRHQEIVLKLATSATNDLIQENLPKLGDDAPPKGGKGAKRQKTSKSSKSSRGSSFKQPAQETNTSASEQPQQQDLVAWVNIPVIDKDEFRDAEEYAYHLEQANKFMENQNGTTEENKYVLSLHKIHVTSFHEEDIEEKMIRWIKHRKVRDDLEEVFSDYMIVEVVEVTTEQQYGLDGKNNYKPNVKLIYLNNKEDKRIMYLVDIQKFCDATLEKVLKEVKLKIFVTEFKMKIPLLGKLELKIMKAYEREIVKRLTASR
ncbi:hypothetical protein Tco_1019144 [Tanacetum coccineum]|uniref:Uncharacterized protein n=1 Tax=Tanacetum coccineum TaxID=301880 RepID=A0ABQ5FWT9_9ASTR